MQKSKRCLIEKCHNTKECEGILLVIYLYNLNYQSRTAFRGIYIVYVLVIMHNLLWQLF